MVSDSKVENISKQNIHHQAGMDKKIENPRSKWKKPAMYGGGALVFLVILYMAFQPGGGRTLKIANDRIVVSTVSTGQFDDFIPVRGRVTPLKTVFLDAIEGGRVEERFVEDGVFVEVGQPIIQLSNTQLQLDVISRNAQVTEQINNLRNRELALEQNRLGHKRNLVDINYQIIRLQRIVDRYEPLLETGAVTRSAYNDAVDELTYYNNRLEVTLESQASDERLQQAQMKQLTASAAQLEFNLKFAEDSLSNLNVTAPVAGKLTAFDLEIGQSVGRGERIGQLDDPTQFKVSAQIDEFYLGRVDIGQTAELNTGGSPYTMEIVKVYPQVTNGQFEVDMIFQDDTPANIRRGQTLQTRLQLGDPTEAILIPNGAFYQDTGGNWIFVVSADGSQAVRRTVRLGRRNLRFIEVLDGLEPGERVVTSPYTSYVDMDRLELGSS
jgi:HlyD family secretion protein